MNKINKEILKQYQVRKTYDQKSKFIDYLMVELQSMNYELKIEKNKKNRNLIVGDINSSQMILTAHYDTPPNSIIPIVTFISSIPMYIFSQLLTFIPWIIIYFALSGGINNILWLYEPNQFISFLLTLALVIVNIVPLLVLIQMSFGIANKHTMNDNTSGVTTLINIMSKLDEANRSKVAFVFFDQEEAGLIGSNIFSKKYKDVAKNIPLINFDCVSNGSHFLFVCKQAFRDHNYYALLKDNLHILNKPAQLHKASKIPYMSDQLYFKLGVGVVSVKKIPLLGFYLNRIHSSRDTIYEVENIDQLSNLMLKLINDI